MNQKQYHIPRGAGEISATIKDLNAAGVVVPTASLLNLGTLNFLSVQFRREMDCGEWPLTIEKSNKFIIPITTAVADMVSLLEKIDKLTKKPKLTKLWIKGVT